MMMNNSDINYRISLLIENQSNNNQKKFAEMIGFAPQVVSNIVSGRKSKPSFEVLTAIISSFDDLSVEWLITGKGEMLKSSIEEENIIKEDASGYSMANTLLEQLSKLTETVLSQQKTIESLIETNKKAVAHLGDNATNADAKGA